MRGMLADQTASPAAAEPARVRTPVAAADAVWLQDTPQNPMIINALYVCDRLEVEALREVFRKNVLEVDGGRRFDRFGKRVVTIDGRYFWEPVADFDVSRHVFRSSAEGIRTKEDLQGLLGEMAAQPLPGDRPLWQLQVIDFGDDSAVIIRIHHCMGDGMALLPVVFALVGCLPQVAATHKPRYARAAIKAVAAAAAPYVLVEKALRVKDANVLRGQVMSGTKRVAWSAPLPVARVREVKSCLGATVNDVLMSCVAGAIHRYDQLEGQGRLRAVRATVPFNVRGPHEPYEMNNKFAAVLLLLPVGPMDPRERVMETKRRMDKLKRSVEPLVMYGAASFMLKVLPPRASRKLIDFYANKCSCVLTNVPGPSETLYVAGSRLHNMMFWVPQRAGIGVGISILSFSGTVRMGVIADAEFVADPGSLVAAFEEEFWTLAELVGA